MSTFSSINVASQALQAFQQALDVTGNNISNANTPGYARETITYAENPQNLVLSVSGESYVGTGTNVAGINAMRNMFLQAQSYASASNMGKTGSELTGSQQVQSLFTDATGSGISNDLTTFYNSLPNPTARTCKQFNKQVLR
jgi:flagellar hook-associated protein 1